MKCFNFLRNSISNKIYISYIVLIIFTSSFISSALYWVFRNNLYDQTITLTQQYLDQIARDLTTVIHDYGADLFLSYLIDFDKLYPNSKDIQRAIEIYSYAKTGITEAFYYVSDLDETFFFDERGIIDDFKDIPLYDFMKLNSNLIKNNWIIDPLFIQFDEKQNIIHMIQPINSIKYFKYRGFYIAGFSKKYLASLLFHQEENFKQNLIVCNAYGVVIFDFSDGQKFVREAQRYFLPGTKYPSKSVSLDGEEFQILSSQSEDGSLYIIKFISTTRLMSVPNKVKTWILGSLFISILLGISIGFYINHTITKSIKVLIDNIKFIEEGHFDRRIEPHSYDEIGQLALSFNRMTDTLQETINRKSEAILEKERAEYRLLQAEYNALQSKVRPHFLYNVLESISSMAKLKRHKDIVHVVTALGSLLRRSFQSSDEFVSLSEELEYVKNYLNIQKVMLGDKFFITYHIESVASRCRVPRFILQPLIENAITHGIEESNAVGIIKITAEIYDGKLYINVYDNGKGINEKEIKQILLSDTMANEKVSNSFGIRSVLMRIKTLYGSSYGMQINSSPNTGTQCILKLPATLVYNEGIDV